jgi:ribosomal protein S18 acetylase RimI-like enzyme
VFWIDPPTATCLVEPLRTEDDHQRGGRARHLLTAGIALLAEAGALRIKIVFRPDNPASKGLYLSVGFEPVKQTAVFSRRASETAS